ncbi:MAG: hypothetical protein JNK82_32965 [Myxococcaceae bacterium]|nr:hypothetical protein [Myxococcaceae bacterium]
MLLCAACSGPAEPGGTGGGSANAGGGATAGGATAGGATAGGATAGGATAGGATAGGATAGGATAGGATAGGATAGGGAGAPLVTLEVRDLLVMKYGVTGAAIIMRSGAAIPAAGCVRYQGNGPALPSAGNVTASGLAFSTALSCNTSSSGGVPETRCFKSGAGPIPVAGSTLDTYTYLGAMDPTLGVTGGAALGAVSLTPVNFDGGTVLTAPTTLVRDAGTDLTVTWSPSGVPTLVELEVFDGGSSLVLCAPTTAGTLTLDANLISGRIDRLTVGQFSEATGTDAMGRPARARVLKGAALSP